MARTTARPRTEAEIRALKAQAARQRRERLKAAATGSAKKAGLGGKGGKGGKVVIRGAKASAKKETSGVKGGRKCNKCGREKTKIVNTAATKSKAVVSKKGAVNKQKNNKNSSTKKGKPAASATKKSKAATPIKMKSKAKTAVVQKAKAAPVAGKGRKAVARGKAAMKSPPTTKRGRGQPATTTLRQAVGKGRQLTKTVATRGKGGKGLTAATKATPAAAKGQKRAARGPASATAAVKAVAGRKRAAQSTALTSHQPPPAKLARMNSFSTEIRKAIAEAAKSRASAAHDKKTAATKTYKIDDVLKGSVSTSAKVYKDYSCMLNQTNIGFNNNKYYVIQVVEEAIFGGNRFIYFTRWGRVGESGQNRMERFTDVNKAVKAFEKKFWDKTHNGWSSRNQFAPKPKKYTLLEMDEDEDEDDSPKALVPKKITNSNVQSSLDERTQRLARIIFSDTMFTQQMAEMNLDVNKMPLGKLSKSQIAKGLEALLDIEEAIKKGNRGALNQLTSKFYTLIPHNFGRSVPPVIGALGVVQQKKDMLITLADIELTQTLQKNKGASAPTQNPLDAKINALGCTLAVVQRTSPEFKWIREYAAACPNTRKHTLLDVWRVDRDGEHTRFNRNGSIKYRKLLWHGTKVAVVAAILNSGLRIMPHSGGRVGRGIYFASEHAKSSWYVGIHNGAFEGEKNIGFMFLVEVALGRMNNITSSSGQQKVAPPGYDSIVARGWTEPDSGDEMEINYDGKKVIVPKGKPKTVETYRGSHFSQSEYLVYREDQARIRYLLKFSFA